MKNKIEQGLVDALSAFATGVLTAALFAGLVQVLWNWLVPDLFLGPRIGFWQALGLSMLCSLLFKSSARHGSSD